MDIALDELVDHKLQMDKFFTHLTPQEKDFIECKLDGWSEKRIRKERSMSTEELDEIKDDIRFKIGLAFM